LWPLLIGTSFARINFAHLKHPTLFTRFGDHRSAFSNTMVTSARALSNYVYLPMRTIQWAPSRQKIAHTQLELHSLCKSHLSSCMFIWKRLESRTQFKIYI